MGSRWVADYPKFGLLIHNSAGMAAYYKKPRFPSRKQGTYSVGATGFEPATPATPLQCATGLRHAPINLST